ncbi:hypothetical protein GOBAR_DD00540 [Gossypium barbadense]|nr:hypothetical protein GOBAR_DD00540 [Gossypium barbadense]
MLLRSGRRTSKFPVNITDQQAESHNLHEPNDLEDIDMANQTLKQLAAPNLAAQPPPITYPALDRPLKLNSGFLNLRSDLGKRMDEGKSSIMEAQLANLTAMKKETDGRFQSLELAVKQLQTRASSTDVNLGNLQAQKVQNSDKVDETKVRKVRFSDIEEENIALPKADLQPSQAAPKEVGKSRSEQSTTLCDTVNFEQETRVPELQAQARQDANNQPRLRFRLARIDTIQVDSP